MCNIAGYAGNKQAAPILLEMIRRQEPYDGGMATGIATLHEGKIYTRKIFGNADRMIHETDALDLPGTVGIIHTFPGRNSREEHHHPSLSPDESIALVANGTMPITRYSAEWDDTAKTLEEEGYSFRYTSENPQNKSPKLHKSGRFLAGAELLCFAAHRYIKQGDTPFEALAKIGKNVYSDIVTVMVHRDFSDRIFALRTTRSMYAVMENGESYLATTPFAFPSELQNQPISLPVFHPCSLSKNGLEIARERIQSEPIEPLTPKLYLKSYLKIEALLKSEKAPLYFDELESFLHSEKDLWENGRTLTQHACLVYELLYQLEREGRLKREMRIQKLSYGDRPRWYFSL